MKQIITRVDESLAEAVKAQAALTGESVNAYVTRLLSAAVGGRQAWKKDAIGAGLLVSREAEPASGSRVGVSTPLGYGSDLVAAEREER